MIPHPGLESNLGKLLIYFLQLFGYKFEYMRLKIVVRTDGTGCWAPKSDPKRVNLAPATMLSIDDPLDPST
jgi:DNA polymerase sigma